MKEFGLIGYPLGHSFSQKYFTDKFLREGIEGRYELYPIKQISALPRLLHEHPLITGLNVTIPYKEIVISYLDFLSDDARAIGAVNVINIEKDINGNVKSGGYNTDWIGFLDSLKRILSPEITSALVLGTGGASKAVCHALNYAGLNVTRVSRNPADHTTLAYRDLDREIMRRNQLIVNTTPLGMWPEIDKVPDIPYQYITCQHVCYDVVYNPAVTEFMKRCAEQGATVKNGLEMLRNQAEAAWTIWNNEKNSQS